MPDGKMKYDVRKFSKQLEERTKKFALSIVRLSTQIPNSPEGKVIRNQITKSGTSIGANYREANRARSKADFRNKIRICESEASECQYWLEIIQEMEWIRSEEYLTVRKESGELLALFNSIGRNSRDHLS